MPDSESFVGSSSRALFSPGYNSHVPAIAYKIKVRPEDFQVKEITDLLISSRGPYRLYRLTKCGWNTVDLLLRLARRFNLPLEAFAYGGKKDRHALTEQYITVEEKCDLSLVEPAYRLESLGFSAEPMSASLIKGNSFSVVLRNIRREQAGVLEANAEEARRLGLPNYFDDQRFGSLDPGLGFAAERLLRGEWEEGVKIALTSIYPGEKKAARTRKRALREHWGDWRACLEAAGSSVERAVFKLLVERGPDFAAAANLIPREQMSMLLSAYQSFLWNETAAELVRQVSDDTVELPGRAGKYLFHVSLGSDALHYLATLELPTAGASAMPEDELAAHIFKEKLAERGLERRAFALPQLKTAYFKSFERKLLLFPEELALEELSEDELYPGRLKARLSFTLPRGAYGTMVIKRLSLIR